MLLMSNQKLASMPIYNLRRSQAAIIQLHFEISFRTPLPVLKELRKRIAQYLKDNKDKWKPMLDFYVFDTSKTNSMILRIWVQNQLGWHEGYALNMARSDIIHCIRLEMQELNIELEQACLPVRMAGEPLHTSKEREQ